MTDSTLPSNSFFKFCQDMFQNQRDFVPSAAIARRLITAGSHVLDAQIAYTQAILSANAEWLAAWSEKPNTEDATRPSVAAKQNEVMAA